LRRATRATRRQRRQGGRLATVALAGALLAALPVFAGCGGDDERTSNPRPPTAINVAVRIGDDRVIASPSRFGAGPINIIASNQSSASHRLTIDGPRLRRSVGPINPQDTATLKVSVTPGEYQLATDSSSSVKPVRLQVGAKRPSAQNELQLP
jgi:hypothetical protein